MEEQHLNTVLTGKSGYPIILLHGWGHSINSMRALGDLLSRHAQVHLIDLPGFGQSPRPASDWDTTEYAECVFRYMQAAGLEKADVLGHSFGGRVCIRLASRHADKIRSVVLINSGGLRRTLNGQRKLRAKVIGLIGKALKQIDKTCRANLFESWFVPNFGSADYRNAGALRNILVKTVNEDISTDAASISCPTFILWGELDTETPLEMGERLHKLIPNSKLLVLPGKDHHAMIGEGAHICARYIIDFLTALPGSNAKEPADPVGEGAPKHA